MDDTKVHDVLTEILQKHFGVSDIKDLVLCALTLDVKSLVVQYENISVPFTVALHTHIQAVSTVDDTVLLWLGHTFPLHIRTQEFGFDALITCGKILYDAHGFRLIFEGLDSSRKLDIHHQCGATVTIESKNPQ